MQRGLYLPITFTKTNTVAAVNLFSHTFLDYRCYCFRHEAEGIEKESNKAESISPTHEEPEFRQALGNNSKDQGLKPLA